MKTNTSPEWVEFCKWRDECHAVNARNPNPPQHVLSYAECAARDAMDRT